MFKRVKINHNIPAAGWVRSAGVLTGFLKLCVVGFLILIGTCIVTWVQAGKEVEKQMAMERAALKENVGAIVTLASEHDKVWLFETESNYRTTMTNLGHNMYQLQDKGSRAITEGRLVNTTPDATISSGATAKVVQSGKDCSQVEILDGVMKGKLWWVGNYATRGLPHYGYAGKP